MNRFFIVTAVTLGLTLTSCGYNPDKPDPAYHGNLDGWLYELEKYEGKVPEGYSLGKISEIDTGEGLGSKSGDVWSVKYYGLGHISAGYLTLPKSKVRKLGLHKGDVIAVSRDGKDVKKLPLYIKAKPEIKKYDAEKLNEAYGGKSLKELVPDWPKYPFEKLVHFYRITSVSVSNYGEYDYSFTGPDGFSGTRSVEYDNETSFEKNWHVGDIIKMTFTNFKSDPMSKTVLEKMNEYHLISSDEWKNMKDRKNSEGDRLQSALESGPFPVKAEDYR
ncbi:MAG: hypothetical protein LBK65_06660 [Tannerellaceae bacterium]|nr:hypothetical protein [Tannerellaceae bacterium]